MPASEQATPGSEVRKEGNVCTAYAPSCSPLPNREPVDRLI